MSTQAEDTWAVAPLQLIAVGFDRVEDIEARIVAEVDRLQGRGVLRLLDFLVVRKNGDGSVTRLLLADDEFGDLLADVVPLEAAELFGLLEGGAVSATDSQARALADSLSPGAVLAFLLVEHRWARPLFHAMADAGGVLLGVGFMSDAAQALVGSEVAAFDQAAQGIAVAQAVETEAARQARAAVSAAEDTVAAAEAVQATAAADAVGALIDAGLIESAAAEEAAEAIIAARRDIDTARQDVARATMAASVTAGEIRVLRYLPTRMTFAVLADKLGISRSAAKERAERAYKKLGVHNRADAVTRARELKLVPQHP